VKSQRTAHATLHRMETDRGAMPDEPPPFLGTWRRVYAVVVLYLAALIASFYAFTRAFS